MLPGCLVGAWGRLGHAAPPWASIWGAWGGGIYHPRMLPGDLTSTASALATKQMGFAAPSHQHERALQRVLCHPRQPLCSPFSAPLPVRLPDADCSNLRGGELGAQPASRAPSFGKRPTVAGIAEQQWTGAQVAGIVAPCTSPSHRPRPTDQASHPPFIHPLGMPSCLRQHHEAHGCTAAYTDEARLTPTRVAPTSNKVANAHRQSPTTTPLRQTRIAAAAGPQVAEEPSWMQAIAAIQQEPVLPAQLACSRHPPASPCFSSLGRLLVAKPSGPIPNGSSRGGKAGSRAMHLCTVVTALPPGSCPGGTEGGSAEVVHAVAFAPVNWLSNGCQTDEKHGRQHRPHVEQGYPTVPALPMAPNGTEPSQTKPLG
ncbi:hypothetical protein PCL_00232 [Purpureocillium lilacinum]|uniref:Uncharacterized protein n=1 Tax=Purpureocillium lilacinum TaxID=33203 RepID=A0A2U3E6C9_PURLI|nr:hypothetical protein PCL_00232 [Purpureocillium lilacinum]